MLGKFVLHHQLYLNRLMDPGTPMHEEFLATFNSMWTDNADAISLRYTGAAAMKTNFTRTGIHGLRGQLQDGVTAAGRFVEQMLRDPSKQDAMNLFVGKYSSRRIGGLSPNAAADGVVRVKAYKQSTWKVGAEYAVAFEINKKDVLIYDWDNQKVRVFPLESLRLLSPSAEDGAVLALGFDTAVSAKVLRFQNPLVRHKIVARLVQLAPNVHGEAARAGARLSVCVAHVNLMHCGAARDLAPWLERGHDVYVVSCANAIFRSPDEFVFVGAQYLFFQVLSFLRPEAYECCGSAESATGDGTLVLCRRELRGRLAAVDMQAVTRSVRPNDPEFLKRAAYASSAHRQVARSKSQARVDALGSPLRVPRRRGTVDIQKEVTQIGFTCTLCVDDGPPLHIAHLWDFATPVPDTHRCERVIVTGYFAAPEGAQCVVRGENKEDGAIAAVLTVPGDGLLSELRGAVAQLECDGSEVDVSRSDGEMPLTPATSRPSSQLSDEGGSVVANVDSGVGSDLTLSKIKASLDAAEAPALRAGVVRVNASGSEAPAVVPLPSRTCPALRATFMLQTSPLLQAFVEPAGSVLLELREVRVAEWTTKWPPSKLRLEFASRVLVEESVTTSLSENGVWAKPVLLTPWTVEYLRDKVVAASLTGFPPSTSSLGGFLSTITGTASLLATARLPLALLEAGGVFRVPLYAVNQEVQSSVVYGWLCGIMALVRK